MYLRESDLRRFSHALLRLYGTESETASFAERACAFLGELVPSEFVVLGSLDRQSQQLSLFVDQSVPGFGDAMRAYSEEMRGHACFRWDPSVNEGRPFFLSDFLGSQSFRSGGMYARVYRALGIDNHCAVLIPDTGESIDFFGIERLGGPDFDSTDRALLALAQDHLKNARALERARGASLTNLSACPEALQRNGLTTRESETLYWIAEGKSNGEIASLLGLRLLTVKGYLKSIFQKIGAANRLGAALWALRVSHSFRSAQLGSDQCVRIAASV